MWVGHGGPNLNTAALPGQWAEHINQYVHETTNMLVDARVSLFVIYPGLKVQQREISISARDADANFGNSEPFAGDVNFGVFVNETGGKLFFNRNDVDAEMSQSQQLGSEYYTLTYQPHEGDADGKFRRIRVMLRNPNLQVMTKAGYFAPAKGAPVDPRQQMMIDISQAARSSVPFTALDVKIAGVVRHPDTRTAELTVVVNGKNLSWQPDDNGKEHSELNAGCGEPDGEKRRAGFPGEKRGPVAGHTGSNPNRRANSPFDAHDSSSTQNAKRARGCRNREGRPDWRCRSGSKNHRCCV